MIYFNTTTGLLALWAFVWPFIFSRFVMARTRKMFNGIAQATIDLTGIVDDHDDRTRLELAMAEEKLEAQNEVLDALWLKVYGTPRI